MIARGVPDASFLNHRETPQCECPGVPPRESRELWTQAVHGTPGGQKGPLSGVRAGPDANLSRPTPAAEVGFHPDGSEKSLQAALRSGWWGEFFFFFLAFCLLSVFVLPNLGKIVLYRLRRMN